MIRDRWEKLPPLARALIPGLVLVGLGAWAFVEVLDEVVERDRFEDTDQPLIEWLAGHRVDWLTTVLTIITDAFGPVLLPIWMVIGCGIWVWRTRSWRDPALLAGAMVLSTAISTVVKITVARARPEDDFQLVPGHEGSFSFPSGHTTAAATLVLVAAYLLWHQHRGVRSAVMWALAALLLITLVAATRLYLGYHFLSDVIAGACLGFAVLGVVVAVDRWLDMRHGGRDRESSELRER